MTGLMASERKSSRVKMDGEDQKAYQCSPAFEPPVWMTSPRSMV